MDRIDDDRKHIRVLDNPILDIFPVLPTISRLPRQMPRSCINNLRVIRVDRQRLNLVDLSASRRADQRPVRAFVETPIHPTQRSRHDLMRIGKRPRHRTYRLTTHLRLLIPGLAAILANEQAAIRLVDLPRTNKQVFWIGRVYQNMVQYKVVALPYLRHACPVRTTVVRLIQPPRRSAEIQVFCIMRISGKRPRVSAIGAEGKPRNSVRHRRKVHTQQHTHTEPAHQSPYHLYCPLAPIYEGTVL